MIGVRDIEQISAGRIPETRVKAFQTARERLFPALVELAADPQSVQPERKNNFRLPASHARPDRAPKNLLRIRNSCAAFLRFSAI
jgi:hypothetical protein